MLDEAGLQDCKIVISNSLDEFIIRDVISQGACIDSFGVGERADYGQIRTRIRRRLQAVGSGEERQADS